MPLLFASELIVGKCYSCCVGGRTYSPFILLQKPAKTNYIENTYTFKVLFKGQIDNFMFKLNDTFVELDNETII